MEITKRGIKIQTFYLNIPRDKRKNVAFDILTEGLVSQEMSPTTQNNGWSPGGCSELCAPAQEERITCLPRSMEFLGP